MQKPSTVVSCSYEQYRNIATLLIQHLQHIESGISAITVFLSFSLSLPLSSLSLSPLLLSCLSLLALVPRKHCMNMCICAVST